MNSSKISLPPASTVTPGWCPDSHSGPSIRHANSFYNVFEALERALYDTWADTYEETLSAWGWEGPEQDMRHADSGWRQPTCGTLGAWAVPS
jgi:hypothetical protein